MTYKNLQSCIADLEKTGQLIRIKEEVDPELEMATIHLLVHENKGKAVLFENIKGCKYQAVSNLFGTVERGEYLFRDTLEQVQKSIQISKNPLEALKKPFANLKTLINARKAIPKKVSFSACGFQEINISDLPQIKCWHDDGGAFITLPQVYTEDIEKPGVMNSNLGMYRIQLSGNEYDPNKEIGLHYQIHRGIGIHQTKANEKGKPLEVSIFVGGSPAHSLAAVMPLPEGISELSFAGLLDNRRFRYARWKNYCISADADFVICGKVYPNENKPEGPFGDHFGYYSLKHDFPVMKVEKVFAKENAIWSFTVVGRPPQEDTTFGKIIHNITGAAISDEIPGVEKIHAVDAAGVHPLLFAIGNERYTPFQKIEKPQEILTQANRILGTGQLSLAKYLFITAKQSNPKPDIFDEAAFLKHILERVDWQNDIHFHTHTTIDTLDYSGTDLNSGSKVVVAAVGEKKRNLATEWKEIELPVFVKKVKVALAGVAVFECDRFSEYENEAKKINNLSEHLSLTLVADFPLIVLADDADFASQDIRNFLWTTFTKSNPSHDIYGVQSSQNFKHWGCKGSLIIDARTKPHHAPPLEFDTEVLKKVNRLGEKGGSLFGVI